MVKNSYILFSDTLGEKVNITVNVDKNHDLLWEVSRNIIYL